MKIITILVCIGLVVACSRNVPAQTNGASKAEYHKISAEEAHKMMSELQDFILIDVRTEEEFLTGHIIGAILIPDYEIKARAGIELPDKNTMILVYCRSGRRSENATRELVGMGYTNVFDFGGILDWPYEVLGTR
jgi:rhodanese-related sulfurtransferase